jgi:ABC-type glycerol-3-phosphate transport system permease component
VNTASRPQVVLNYLLMIVCSMVAIYPLVGVLLASLYPAGPGSAPSGFALPPSFAWRNYVEAGEVRLELHDQRDRGGRHGPRFGGAVDPGGLRLRDHAVPGLEGDLLPVHPGADHPHRGDHRPALLRRAGPRLLDTYWALILLETSGELAFGIFWMRAAFISAPRSLLEAARIDGASSWRTLWRILVPFARPAILTLTVLTFADSWNEFFLALVFTVNHMTAPAGLASFSGRFTTNVPLVSAGAVIVAVPILVVFIVFQRQFIRGVLTGAVKG